MSQQAANRFVKIFCGSYRTVQVLTTLPQHFLDISDDDAIAIVQVFQSGRS
jgi:hypothetical protein